MEEKRRPIRKADLILTLVILVLALGGYYILIGITLTRFIFASLSNAVFDRFINSRMEGVKVNRGLAEADDDGEEAPEEQKEE